jgi:5-hmdU DNA kinase, helical domain/Uncharacterised protein family UPF0547
LVFERRLEGKAAPWTDDEILQEYRFCNVFRASDRVSQALIEVAYAREDFSAEDLFLRVMLFRLFSRPETWELIEAETGLLTAANFDEEKIGRMLDRAFEEGSRLYTAAFILCAADAFGHRRKHRNHLALVASMLQADLPERVAKAPSLSAVYAIYNGTGDRTKLEGVASNAFLHDVISVNGSPAVGIYAAGAAGLMAMFAGFILAGNSVSSYRGADRRTRMCPDCAETVLEAARICKHCGHRFDGTATR